MTDLSKLAEERKAKEDQKRIKAAYTIAEELYAIVQSKDIFVQDASLVIKFINDIHNAKAQTFVQNKKISEI